MLLGVVVAAQPVRGEQVRDDVEYYRIVGAADLPLEKGVRR